MMDDSTMPERSIATASANLDDNDNSNTHDAIDMTIASTSASTSASASAPAPAPIPSSSASKSTRRDSNDSVASAPRLYTATPRPAIYTRASIELGHGHGRTMAGADTARRAKRFTMTFPINTSAMYDSHTATPSPTRSSPSVSMAESVLSPAEPTDSTFLTAVAAQERRVLELREELIKAEGELKRLKQEWALHEAQRKRHDVRRLQKLQPLQTSAAPTHSQDATPQDDPNGSSAWLQQEMDRRKALLNGTRSSNRTVFSGSRHARTLSLLSPTTASSRPVVPRNMAVRSRSPTAPERPAHPLRLPTDEVLCSQVADTADMNIDLGLPRDVLVKTGKQIATDFRDGLWTFIEDLRQATVGDEGVNGTTTRTSSQLHQNTHQRSIRQQPSRGSLKSLARPQPPKQNSTTSSKRSQALSPSPRANFNDDAVLLDLGGSFWRENGLDEHKIEERPTTKKPSRRKSDTPKKQAHQMPDESLEGWDTWGSPEAEPKTVRTNSDTSVSDIRTSPSPNGTSPRTSMSSVRDGAQGPSSHHDRVKRESIPWPALTKLSPSNLRRTASNLMSDWEKSLTPPADDKGMQQPDYLGRATSPTASLSSAKGTKAD